MIWVCLKCGAGHNLAPTWDQGRKWNWKVFKITPDAWEFLQKLHTADQYFYQKLAIWHFWAEHVLYVKSCINIIALPMNLKCHLLCMLNKSSIMKYHIPLRKGMSFLQSSKLNNSRIHEFANELEIFKVHFYLHLLHSKSTKFSSLCSLNWPSCVWA